MHLIIQNLVFSHVICNHRNFCTRENFVQYKFAYSEGGITYTVRRHGFRMRLNFVLSAKKVIAYACVYSYST